MGSSRIEWTDSSWNPLKARRLDTGKVGWHCERVSEACRYCYAATFNGRNLPNGGTGLDYDRSAREQVEVFIDLDVLRQPLRWRKPRKVFVCSMTDLFAEFVTDEMIAEVWRMMFKTPQHTYQILTKRPERMREIAARLVATFGVLPNVWLGVTAEDQQRADERIPQLLATPSAVRFVSIEPMLGPVNLAQVRIPHGLAECNGGRLPPIDWVIAGGESGPQARPSHPEWFTSLRDQCQAAGVPYFFKQWGAWKPISEMPEAEHSALYRSNRKAAAGEEWRQPDLDERYGKTCKVQTDSIGFDGETGDYFVIDGHPAYQVFRVGKKAAGRLLDGREWGEFPI